MKFTLSSLISVKNTVASLASLSVTKLVDRSRLPLIGSAHQPADTGLILTRIGPSLKLSGCVLVRKSVHHLRDFVAHNAQPFSHFFRKAIGIIESNTIAIFS
ncbi:hypothetical protein PEC302107_38460 [Pectobacterium araliae]|nr:hypothetical protein PEC302107_38460 [Pectobacterium carotovorum subsp. carotovorum]